MEAKKRKQVYICPEVNIPNDSKKRIKSFHPSDVSKDLENGKPLDKKSMKSEMKKFMDSVRKFNANSSSSSGKKNFKDDLLTRLGAPPKKQQTMPFKMKMGILTAREKRRLRDDLQAKEAGLVTTSTTNSKRKKKNNKK